MLEDIIAETGVYMKRYAEIKTLIIIVLCFLIGLYFYTADNNKAANTEIIVTDINASEIKAAVLKNEYGNISLFNIDGVIAVDNDKNAIYSQEKLKSLLYRISHLKAKKEIYGDDQTVYGFDESSAQISILKDKETERFYIGKKHPLMDAYYVKRDIDNKIFLVEDGIINIVLDSFENLREFNLYPRLTNDVMNYVTDIRITNGENKISIHKDYGEYIFQMTEPFDTALDWEKTEYLLVRPIRELEIRNFVSDKEDISQYGLTDNAIKMEIVVADKKYEILFSRKDENTWYCANTNSNIVCSIENSYLSFLNIGYADILGNIYQKNAADISAIEINYNGEYFKANVYGEGENLKSIINDIEFDRDNTIGIFKKINILSIAGIMDENIEIKSEPLISMIYYLRNGKEDIIEIYDIGDRKAAVFINGVSEFMTYRAAVEDIIREIKNLENHC